MSMPKVTKNAMRNFGEEYFRNLLAEEHQSIKFGDELKFRIRFIGEDGKVVSEITETIHKKDL